MDNRTFGRSPSSNLGAKYLDSKQMEANFPDYQALLDRIEDQRKVADFVGRNFGRVDYQKRYPQMYDNVFAILGGRGSGKSSVIQSLWEHLQHNGHGRDIILPIIIPETISDPHCSILGWIMATVEPVIDGIEEQLRMLEDKRGGAWICDRMAHDSMHFFKDCHLQHNNHLREQYESLKRDCIPDLTAGSAFSYDDMVGLQVHLSQKQYALVRNLNRFWDDVTTCWKLIKTLQARDGSTEAWEEDPSQPLIILMFDDVDLVPERSLELLNSTFQYFTNPNIVLILTAAEKVLEQVIWTKMLERMLGSHYESLFTDFYQTESIGEFRGGKLSLGSIDKMAREYYDKVVPPANRYHLRRYLTIADRKRYRYASMGQSFQMPQEDVSIQLDCFLIEQVKLLGGKKKREAFICGDGDQLREAYLLMFGDKSRNIANGCLAILNCVFRLKRYMGSRKQGKLAAQQSLGQVYDALRQMFSVLVSSNRMVKELSGEAMSLIYQGGSSGEIRVDYDGLWNLYNRQCKALSGGEIKAYEQVENEMLEAAVCLREHNRLGRLQRQMAILLVMLTFVDGLRKLACDRISSASNEWSGGLAGGRGLAAVLNNNGITFFGREELRRGWSWLTLFPKELEIEEFLIRSPYVLEHVDHYMEFDPFDQLKVQEYLMDTFHAATADYVESKRDGELPEGRARRGKCSPEELLTMKISGEQTWVKSVLSMLYLQHSGIANMPPDILSFSRASRRILEQFRFGGHLKQAIREGFSYVLKMDLSQSVLREYLDRYYQRLVKRRDPSPKEIDLMKRFRELSKEPINKVFSWYHQNCSQEVRAWMAEWCAVESIDGVREEITQEGFAKWVSLKVEKTIQSVGAYMMKQSGMMVDKKDCEELQKWLNRIPAPNSGLSTARDNCKRVLEGVEDDLRRKEKSSTDSQEDAAKKTLFPLNTLLKYICLLNREHAQIQFYQDKEDEYWKMEMIRGYFELAGRLNPVILPGKECELMGILDKNGKTMMIEVPLNVWVVLMLSMVEHLMPTYFSAKLIQRGDRQDAQVCRNTSLGQYPCEEEVSRQLKGLYQDLLEKRGDTRLVQMMKQVRDQVIELYIEHLENEKDG